MNPIGMVFDIETIPQQRTLDMDPPIEFLHKGSRSNMKAEKLAEHMEMQESLWPQEKVKMGSLDWRYGQILSYGVGWYFEDANPMVNMGLAIPPPNWLDDSIDERIRGFTGDTQVQLFDTEHDLLGGFWHHVLQEPHRHQVGFSCRDFDCPWLLFRSAVNNVIPSRVWRTPRYNMTGDVDLIDLADIMAWQGKFSTTGWTLDRYCEWFGTEYRPRGTGADVFEQYQNGELHKIVEHQVYDILATMSLYKLMAPTLV